jgi:hypothetical protein
VPAEHVAQRARIHDVHAVEARRSPADPLERLAAGEHPGRDVR